MCQMTQAKRFLATMLGGQADRFPFFDLEPGDDTLKRWRQEGLPRRRSFVDHFQLEPHHSVGLTLRSYPFFRMTPGILDDPSVFDRHYDPDQPARYTDHFVETTQQVRRQGGVVYVDASGGGLLQMLGVGDWDSLVAACMAMVERPRTVERLVDRITDFYCICLERVLSQVPVDYACLYEPIASNTGPVISPAMFERFAIPGYRKVIGLLNRFAVPLRVLCTTGGNLSSMLPALLEAGINGLWISNIGSTGMGYVDLRHRLGSRVALIGGIDATALTRDAAAIKKAVTDIVPELLSGGRYLPCLDDRPRSNVPYDHYRLYRELLASIAQGGRV